MKRNNTRVGALVLASTTLAGLVLAGCATTEPAATEPIELTLAIQDPSAHPLFTCGAQYFADTVKEASDGQIVINAFADAQLGNEQEIFESVIAGDLDIGLVNAGRMAELYPPLSVLAAAFLFDDEESLLEVLDGPIGQELWDGLADASPLQVIGTLPYGGRVVSTTDTPATSPEDLAGVKMRAADAPIWIANVEALGGVPTPMGIEEVYVALQQGVVDGQENPVGIFAARAFDEVQGYLIMTNHVFSANQLVMNEESWGALSAEQQTLVLDAASQASQNITECISKDAQTLLEGWRAEGNITIIEDIDIEAFRARAEEILVERFSADWGDLYERIRDAQEAS